MKRNGHKNLLLAPALAFACMLAPGCGGDETAEKDTGDATASLPAGLFVEAAPKGVKPITELKATAKENDEVVVRVVVGGSEEPMVKGRASASIMDAGLDNHCLSDDDHCEKPWDYCCTPKEDKLKHIATLRVVDGDGRIIAEGLGDKIKPGQTLVVKGTVAKRANKDVLTINATGIYVEPVTQ